MKKLLFVATFFSAHALAVPCPELIQTPNKVVIKQNNQRIQFETIVRKFTPVPGVDDESGGADEVDLKLTIFTESGATCTATPPTTVSTVGMSSPNQDKTQLAVSGPKVMITYHTSNPAQTDDAEKHVFTVSASVSAQGKAVLNFEQYDFTTKEMSPDDPSVESGHVCKVTKTGAREFYDVAKSDKASMTEVAKAAKQRWYPTITSALSDACTPKHAYIPTEPGQLICVAEGQYGNDLIARAQAGAVFDTTLGTSANLNQALLSALRNREGSFTGSVNSSPVLKFSGSYKEAELTPEEEDTFAFNVNFDAPIQSLYNSRGPYTMECADGSCYPAEGQVQLEGGEFEVSVSPADLAKLKSTGKFVKTYVEFGQTVVVYLSYKAGKITGTEQQFTVAEKKASIRCAKESKLPASVVDGEVELQQPGSPNPTGSSSTAQKQ